MGWRGTIALALVLALAGAYAYVDIASQKEEISWESVLGPARPTPPGQGNRRILSFRPEDVEAIRLSRDGEEIEIERSGGSWSGVGRPQAIDDFLVNLLELNEILVVDAAAELADHGLDPPRGSIRLQRRGSPPVEIRIGARNPPATGVYVQIDGRPEVILTGALILWEMEKIVRAAGDA
jgi:hypothetical protein